MGRNLHLYVDDVDLFLERAVKAKLTPSPVTSTPLTR